jgi:phosphoglycolate phosphatase-like HAD superfamily hydrolase
LNSQLNYGLITGRTSGELLLLKDRLKNLFQELIHIATDDGDGPRKPSPKLLEFYVEHNLLPLLFVGDSRDDFETVKSAKDHFGDLGFYFAGIANNRDSFNFFQELGADCITYGLNFLLLGLGSD